MACEQLNTFILRKTRQVDRYHRGQVMHFCQNRQISNGFLKHEQTRDCWLVRREQVSAVVGLRPCTLLWTWITADRKSIKQEDHMNIRCVNLIKHNF